MSTVKFTESVEVAVNLGVDPRKSDQVVRGATVLPNGTGRDVRVAVLLRVKTQIKQSCWRGYCGFDDWRPKLKAVDWILM